MHPTRSPRGSGLPFLTHRLFPAAALLAAATALAGCSRKSAPAVEPPPARVLAVAAIIDPHVTDFEDFTGRAEPFKVIELRPQITGELKVIHFTDGGFVNKGDELFTLDDTLFAAQRDIADASLKVARVDVGLKGTLFATAESAFNRGGIGLDAFNTAKAELESAKAKEKLAQAELNKAVKTLGYTRIMAPEHGRLSMRKQHEGDVVTANQTQLTTLVVLDPIYIAFDVDEQTLLRIRRLVGEGKILSSRESPREVLVGLADEAGFSLSAPLTFWDNMIDQNTGTLRLRGEMRNPGLMSGAVPAIAGMPATCIADRRGLRLLSPGMFVRVRMPIGKAYPGILIPEEAIGTEQDRKYVYVITNPADTGTVETRTEDRNGQKVKVEYAVWKGTPEMRWVQPGAQIERPGKTGPVVYRVVGRKYPQPGAKPPVIREGEMVIVTGLQRVRKTKDGSYADVTWLVPKK